MRIYLTERFSGEPVRVAVDGKTVLELEEAHTNWSVGLAGSTEVEMESGATVVVEIPGGKLKASHRIEDPKNRALIIKMSPAGIEIDEQPEPVRFL